MRAGSGEEPAGAGRESPPRPPSTGQAGLSGEHGDTDAGELRDHLAPDRRELFGAMRVGQIDDHLGDSFGRLGSTGTDEIRRRLAPRAEVRVPKDRRLDLGSVAPDL